MGERVVTVGGSDGVGSRPLSDFTLDADAVAAYLLKAFPTTEFTEDGTYLPVPGIQVVELNHISSVVAVTIAAPVKGSLLIIVNTSASSTQAHTVTLTAGDFDGSDGNIATIDAPEDCLIVYGISASRYVILENLGSIGLT